jgi:hypothetical protein
MLQGNYDKPQEGDDLIKIITMAELKGAQEDRRSDRISSLEKRLEKL